MLTEQERRRVLYHLDYPQISLPTTLSLGLPVVTQARFIIEQNVRFADPGGEQIVREILARLDCILSEIDQARRALIIAQTGDTKFREDALPLLWIEYGTWRKKLADTLASQPNPVSNSAGTLWGDGGVIEGC
jgi:hypothetical protein